MLIPVGVLAVLATVGGLLDVAGAWHVFEEWIGEVAHPLVAPTTAQDYATSAVSVALGLAGILIARHAFRSGRELVVWERVAEVLRHKLYFDELYDALLSRPAQVVALRLRDRVETPIVQGSLVEIGHGTIEAARETTRLQTGLLRTYAIAITASVVVLTIVFVAVR
jgi:NADH-quinone oxidoreductase subunit L